MFTHKINFTYTHTHTLKNIYIGKILHSKTICVENLFILNKFLIWKNVNQPLTWWCNDIVIEWSIIIMCYNAITTSYQWLDQHFVST